MIRLRLVCRAAEVEVALARLRQGFATVTTRPPARAELAAHDLAGLTSPTPTRHHQPKRTTSCPATSPFASPESSPRLRAPSPARSTGTPTGKSAEITCSAGHDGPVPNGVDGREVLAAVDSADSRARNRW